MKISSDINYEYYTIDFDKLFEFISSHKNEDIEETIQKDRFGTIQSNIITKRITNDTNKVMDIKYDLFKTLYNYLGQDEIQSNKIESVTGTIAFNSLLKSGIIKPIKM